MVPVRATTYYSNVIVSFDDETTVMLTPRKSSKHATIGLKVFTIVQNRTPVFLYNVETDTIEQDAIGVVNACQYWQLALDHIESLFHPNDPYTKTNGNYWYHVHVANKSKDALERLRQHE